jgi:hypothetical protein
MIKVEDLADAMGRIFEAKREYDECVASCAYSAGYHCSHLRFECEKAQAWFAQELEALIDERVRVALAVRFPDASS